MSNPTEVAITALNILDGTAHRTHWEILEEAWTKGGLGFTGFCAWISEIAVASESWLNSVKPQDFPGVFDYEVSYVLGEWITNYVVHNKVLPPEDEWTAELLRLSTEFFAQGN